jgi:flagellar biosynthesis anti-sigma factor FlgM
MRIIDKGTADPDLSQMVKNDKAVGTTRRDRGSEVGQTGDSAKVSISQEGRELQRIAQLARKGDEIRAEKVKQLKELVSNGQYEIDPQEVAKSILRTEISRQLEKK